MMFASLRTMTAGAFNPLSLSPALWLSDTGSSVGQWDDLSGNARHATQGTGANQPSIVAAERNGRQVRRFDGTNDLLEATFTLTQPLTTIAVFKGSSSAAVQVLIGFLNGSVSNAITHRAATGEFTGMNHGTALAPIAKSSSWQVITTVSNSTSSAVYRDGTLGGSGNAGTSGGTAVVIGADWARGSPCAADIGEILIFPSALSTAKRQLAERYLGAKWAVAVA